MSLSTVLPIAAGGLFVAFLGISILRGDQPIRRAWILPATLSMAFFLYSAYTVSQEGLMGFWVEHTRNLWGVQIWFDLLLGTSAAWLLLLPLARRFQMMLPVWAVLVVCTGNIGLMAMLARALWLKEQAQA